MEFVELHGVVLASAKGPVPKMSEAIAGEPIRGSWWGHPRGKEIYDVLGYLEGSPDVLFCRAVRGKITLVHRRLWPALVRAADHFPAEQLAKIEQEHTERGHHVNHETPFPLWVDAESLAAAVDLSEQDALRSLGEWVP